MSDTKQAAPIAAPMIVTFQHPQVSGTIHVGPQLAATADGAEAQTSASITLTGNHPILQQLLTDLPSILAFAGAIAALFGKVPPVPTPPAT